ISERAYVANGRGHSLTVIGADGSVVGTVELDPGYTGAIAAGNGIAVAYGGDIYVTEQQASRVIILYDPAMSKATNLTPPAITGATQQTYTVGSSDLGQQLGVVATALAGIEDAPNGSALTATVSDMPPQPGNRPRITGNAQVNQTLRTDNGTWTGGTPTSFSY